MTERAWRPNFQLMIFLLVIALLRRKFSVLNARMAFLRIVFTLTYRTSIFNVSRTYSKGDDHEK